MPKAGETLSGPGKSNKIPQEFYRDNLTGDLKACSARCIGTRLA
jgi:hypothetical protein